MEKLKPFKLSTTLEGERIRLVKRGHEHDAEMWEAIDESRLYLREYLFWVDSTKSIEDVQSATEKFLKKWETDAEWAYVIERRSDNRLLGCVGPHLIDFSSRSAELGYWLRQSETGKGYMTEAVRLLEEQLFKARIHRLTICCDIHNKPSANVAVRSGYALEAVCEEALYHYTGLHDKLQYVKFSPFPLL